MPTIDDVKKYVESCSDSMLLYVKTIVDQEYSRRLLAKNSSNGK